ncbi:MAG: leucine-rich repeat domain-containing protein, partial [Alistipes sp.]|nr:leucine-rich repeat domain-containing protein [Alistipes sp.]
MRRFSLLAVVALLVAACTQEIVVETIPAIADDAPETITVCFENEDTRIQLNEAQKTVWTNGDQVSVFYRSDANQKWEYNGPTGSRTADIYRVEAGQYTQKLPKVVVVYPYNENYYINPETCDIQAFMPAEQTYMKDSYGLDGNIMISAGYYNQFSLKNVCGWLKVQLEGNGEMIKSITLRGNNGEQVAGEIYINSADASSALASEMGEITDEGDGMTGGAGGNLVFEDTVIKEVTLDCGNGVGLGAEATAFYIALPPQTFANGLTITVTAVDGTEMIKSTSNEIVIERNHIQPMAALEYDGIPNNEIWYTSTDDSVVEPNATNVFGANILSNTYEDGKGVIVFDGPVTKVGSNAFYGYETDCEKLTSVTIPNGVTEIGDSAFYSVNNLQTINIPNSVKTIGTFAFIGCTSLNNINLPNSLTKIGVRAFSNCDGLTV